MVDFILIVLGLAAGSLANALAWRLKHGQNWLSGRSACEKCGHVLGALDLVPLLSWLSLGGRCRYCKKPISRQHPLVEIITAAVFVSFYLWWPSGLHTHQAVFNLVIWLLASVGLVSLALYDARWQILPNQIIYPTLLVAVVGRVTDIIWQRQGRWTASWHWAVAVLVASGLFWLLFIISKERWIGFGDVRLGWISGTLLAQPNLAALMIFLGSALGTLWALPLLIASKRKLNSQLAYGPFLVAATFLAILFGQRLIDWYKQLFL